MGTKMTHIPIDIAMNSEDKVIHKELDETRIRKTIRKESIKTAREIHERAKQAWIDLYNSQEDLNPEIVKTINEHFEELFE